jgi:hypothetical protein
MAGQVLSFRAASGPMLRSLRLPLITRLPGLSYSSYRKKENLLHLYSSFFYIADSSYTVPKAFSMHETFPKLPGKISKTTWKY